MSKRHFCRVKAHPSQGLLAGMKLGGVAAVGGSLLGYAGAAAIQEQVSLVAKVPPGDRDICPAIHPRLHRLALHGQARGLRLLTSKGRGGLASDTKEGSGRRRRRVAEE